MSPKKSTANIPLSEQQGSTPVSKQETGKYTQVKPKPKSYPLRRHLADRLRLLRKVRKWSQGQVADESGLHRTYISLVERGRCNISLDNLERLADAFGIGAADLISPDNSTQSAEYT
ncbi:MAG: helix-turn-helix transcriptional regulator [Gammaproteobacteria bacterium]|nr:helix-turn-helix transcriptional regulator [Gammaproteobacteria bacterium]